MTSGARRVIFGIKLSEGEAAACDTARGDMPRSEWGRTILLAAAVAVLEQDVMTVPPAPVTERPRVPAPRRSAADPGGPCPHPKGRRQKNGTYCPACGTGGLTSG